MLDAKASTFESCVPVEAFVSSCLEGRMPNPSPPTKLSSELHMSNHRLTISIRLTNTIPFIPHHRPNPALVLPLPKFCLEKPHPPIAIVSVNLLKCSPFLPRTSLRFNKEDRREQAESSSNIPAWLFHLCPNPHKHFTLPRLMATWCALHSSTSST